MSNVSTYYSPFERTNRVLGFLLLFLYVIPIGVFPGTPFAPVNYLFLIIVFNLLLNINRLKNKFTKPVINILITTLLYLLLSTYLTYYRLGEYDAPVNSYRFFLVIIFFLSIDDKKTLFFLLKSFTFLLAFSTIFGILIHYIGEPFASIRMIILNGEDIIEYVGKDDRIVGFANKIFHFGYFLAILPTLLITFYKIERKNKYIYLLVIAYIGIVLNGERATLLFSSLALLYLIYKWFHFQKSVIILIGIFGVFFLAVNIIRINDEFLTRVISQKSDGEAEFRLLRQIAGILSVFESPFIGSDEDTYNNIFYRWYGKVPSSSHNTYINIGMRGGIIGWFLFYLFGKNVIKIIKTFKSKFQGARIDQSIYLGTIVTFVSVLSVGLTHNAGIFSEEKMSNILLGFILSFAMITYNSSKIGYSSDIDPTS